MKILVSTLICMGLLFNVPIAWAKYGTSKAYDLDRETSEKIYGVMKSGHISTLLREAKLRMDPEYYNFLSEKLSKLPVKKFKFSRLSSLNFRIEVSNTIINGVVAHDDA